MVVFRLISGHQKACFLTTNRPIEGPNKAQYQPEIGKVLGHQKARLSIDWKPEDVLFDVGLWTDIRPIEGLFLAEMKAQLRPIFGPR